MNAASYPAECHAYDETLQVLDGLMRLGVAGEIHELCAGEVYIVPAGQAHAVAAGSHGSLLILDPASAASDSHSA